MSFYHRYIDKFMLLSNKEGSKQQPQKPISKLILTLLAPKYHQYEYCPEKYVLDRIVSTNMWSGTNHKTIKQMLLRITTQYNNVSYHNITHAFDVATVSIK